MSLHIQIFSSGYPSTSFSPIAAGLRFKSAFGAIVAIISAKVTYNILADVSKLRRVCEVSCTWRVCERLDECQKGVVVLESEVRCFAGLPVKMGLIMRCLRLVLEGIFVASGNTRCPRSTKTRYIFMQKPLPPLLPLATLLRRLIRPYTVMRVYMHQVFSAWAGSRTNGPKKFEMERKFLLGLECALNKR